jgi:hypothetical protein
MKKADSYSGARDKGRQILFPTSTSLGKRREKRFQEVLRVDGKERKGAAA